jgi:hypothetical protein
MALRQTFANVFVISSALTVSRHFQCLSSPFADILTFLSNVSIILSHLTYKGIGHHPAHAHGGRFFFNFNSKTMHPYLVYPLPFLLLFALFLLLTGMTSPRKQCESRPKLADEKANMSQQQFIPGDSPAYYIGDPSHDVLDYSDGSPSHGSVTRLQLGEGKCI